MSTRYRRSRVPPLVRLIVVVIRLQIDLLDVVLRSIAWLLEHVCTQLERLSAALGGTQRNASVPQQPAPSPLPAIRQDSNPAPRGRPEPQPLTNVDKLAAKLHEPKRGKPDADDYELAERMLASANGKAH